MAEAYGHGDIMGSSVLALCLGLGFSCLVKSVRKALFVWRLVEL